MINFLNVGLRTNSLKAVLESRFSNQFKKPLRKFRSQDDGAMVILTLFFMVAMLIIGGFGMAVMRHEMNRAKLSAVIDAAVLAGAGAPSTASVADIKDIVEDYFDKNGMAENLVALDTDGEGDNDDIVTSLNATRVSARASMVMETYLLKLAGVDTLTATSAGTAEIATPKLEVSLVLDVSGSMRNGKLDDLKVAAKEFVTTILDSGEPGDISISVIPFSTGVTPPDTIFNALTIDTNNVNSNCIVFKTDDFDDTAINPDTTYVQRIYTSRTSSGNPKRFGKSNLNNFYRSCYMDDYFTILPYSMDETALHAKIDSFTNKGFTSGHLGIKWGAALLDPAFKPVAAALRLTGEVDNALSNVPATWEEPEVLKIIVMMSDGANTLTRRFNDPNGLTDPSIPENHTLPDYRGPGSDLFEVLYDDPEESAYFLYASDSDTYKDIDDVINDSDTDLDNGYLTPAEFAGLSSELDNYQETNQLTWETAWGLMSPKYYDDAVGGSAAYSDFNNQQGISGGTKNTRMAEACTAIKNEGVIVYTIGFAVPVNGTAETQLRNCAASVAHYFPVTGVTINDAFSTIASDVQNLRLTQ